MVARLCLVCYKGETDMRDWTELGDEYGRANPPCTIKCCDCEYQNRVPTAECEKGRKFCYEWTYRACPCCIAYKTDECPYK